MTEMYFILVAIVFERGESKEDEESEGRADSRQSELRIRPREEFSLKAESLLEKRSTSC